METINNASKKPVTELDEIEQFDLFIKEGKVCVDFWAPWCGPCLGFAPLFEDVAIENPHVKFAKVNIDSNQQAAINYSVKSIPTIILFENGLPVKTHVGRMSKDEFEIFLS